MTSASIAAANPSGSTVICRSSIAILSHRRAHEPTGNSRGGDGRRLRHQLAGYASPMDRLVGPGYTCFCGCTEYSARPARPPTQRSSDGRRLRSIRSAVGMNRSPDATSMRYRGRPSRTGARTRVPPKQSTHTAREGEPDDDRPDDPGQPDPSTALDRIDHESHCRALLLITFLDRTPHRAAYDSGGRSASGPGITPSPVPRVGEVKRK